MTPSTQTTATASRPIESDPLAALDALVDAWSEKSRAAERLQPGAARILGLEIGYPIGVAPSQNTRTPRHVAFFADRGFNLLTYKTVRSREWAPHPKPLWIYLEDLTEPIGKATDLRSLTAHGSPEALPRDWNSYSTANSYGVPSPTPERWQSDFAEAQATLGQGQLLVASVQGSPEIFRTAEALAADFVDVARKAEEADAAVVELNLSCPNTVTEQGSETLPPICDDPHLAAQIVKEVREALSRRTHLVAKLSYLESHQVDRLVDFIGPYITALSGINTLQACVCGPEGEPVFRGTFADPDRPRAQAGVSGVALRLLAREFVRSAALARSRHGAHFDIIGIGGVMVPQDVSVLLELGANAVQTATTAARNPDFAVHVLEEEGRGPD